MFINVEKHTFVAALLLQDINAVVDSMGDSFAPKLGQILLRYKVITPQVLRETLCTQHSFKMQGGRQIKLGHMLLMNRAIKSEDLTNALREQSNWLDQGNGQIKNAFFTAPTRENNKPNTGTQKNQSAVITWLQKFISTK